MMMNTLSTSFSLSLDEVINYSLRFHKQYGFIIIVLDHINEQQNHITELTSALLPIIRRNIRSTDTIIRFSQDCWLVCLDNCDSQILQWTHHVLESILYRRKLQVTNYEGALSYVHSAFLDSNTRNQVIQTIEHSVEQAKSALRRQKTIRSATLISENLPTEEEIDYVPLINKAILDNRLFIAFQPIVNSTTGKTHHYECLARIVDEHGQVYPAYLFIPQCERSGLIQLLDQRMQQLAIEELMTDPRLKLALNVSAITASDPQWLNTLKAQLTARPDLRSRLMIELTETSVFSDIDESVEFMSQLRNLGCPITIDDFGAGYMSLTHIKSDLVQTVKIDAQFVRNLRNDPNNIHFIRAITALTQPYNISCVAEGVEDQETATLLAQEKIEYLQGYHIGKPSSIRQWV